MFYTVEVRNNDQVIGNYRLDEGSLDFHLRLENRIPFDYIDYNKYQCCYAKINEADYEQKKDSPIKEFKTSSFNAYDVESEQRKNIEMNLIILVREAL